MTNILKNLGFVILYIMLFIVLLFTSLQVVVYNDAFFRWHYVNHDIETTTGMDVDELMVVTDKMMDYLIDRRDTLDMTAMIDGQIEEVFGQREKLHMVDVKDLFLGGRLMRNVSFFCLIICIALMAFKKKEWLNSWLANLWKFFIASFLVIGALGVLFASDFNKYFTIFHEIFFDNDLWLLNPKTDILINMVPEIFFFQTVMLIIGLFIISIIAVLVTATFVRKRLKV